MKPHFLIVDDEPQSALVLTRLLRSSQFDFTIAPSIAQAGKLLIRDLPHALIVDVKMPGEISGLQWIASLRNGPFQDIPAIILSSSRSPEVVASAIGLNALDYIIKPASYPILFQKMARLCEFLERADPYQCRLPPGAGLGAIASLPASITGICETALFVEGHFRWPSECIGELRPIPFETAFFEQQGLAVPALAFAGSECGPEEGTHRNHFALLGWKEADRCALRKWVWQREHHQLPGEARFDLSGEPAPIHFEQEVEVTMLGEENMEFFANLDLAPRSRVDVILRAITIKVSVSECSFRSGGRRLIRARIDPDTPSETLRALRGIVLAVKKPRNGPGIAKPASGRSSSYRVRPGLQRS